MAAKRLRVRQIRTVLKLRYENQLPQREIARVCGIGNGTVSECLRRAREAGVEWPLADDLTDEALEQRLYPSGSSGSDLEKPDFASIHRELSRPGVTLQLLWIEYREVHPEGYSYSRFCELYQRFRGKLHVTMRQVHVGGKQTFVDFSGKKPQIVDPKTGEVEEVELFVGVLGASSYIYAEATRSQSLPDWIAAHIRMNEFFGGSSEIYVPDNLKSGVDKPCRYEPGVNRTYEEMAEHYGAVVVPARPYKSRDKAKAEASVLIVQRWIIGVLRNRTFFSLQELNEAIWDLLPTLNDRPLQKLGMSRRERFEQLDRPHLRPLPPRRYEIGHWRRCNVNIDYHIDIERNYYSVPYTIYPSKVDARFTETTVEIFHRNVRVASHRRLHGKGKHVTTREHMPRTHQEYADWTPDRLVEWAGKTGPYTEELVTRILKSRSHPVLGYRSCLGVLRLGEAHGTDRLEAASKRALRIQSHSYQTVKNILDRGMDKSALEEPAQSEIPLPDHENIRGADYYGSPEETA